MNGVRIAGLLLVVFDDLRRAHLCLVWVTPKLSQGSTLTQQIPALVEFDVYLRQAVTVVIREFTLCIEPFLLLDQAVDVTQYRLIFALVSHRSLLLRAAAAGSESIPTSAPLRTFTSVPNGSHGLIPG